MIILNHQVLLKLQILLYLLLITFFSLRKKQLSRRLREHPSLISFPSLPLFKKFWGGYQVQT